MLAFLLVIGCAEEGDHRGRDTGGDTDPPTLLAPPAVPTKIEAQCVGGKTMVDVGGIPNATPIPRIDAWQETAAATWVPAGTITEIDFEGMATVFPCDPGLGTVYLWVWP